MALHVDPVYFYTIHDIAGVAAAHVYLSVLNPSASAVAHVALQEIVSTYTQATTTASNSLIAFRITAHSGGTLVNNAIMPRFLSTWPNPQSEVRIGGPTTTPAIADAQALSASPPVIAVGSGQSNTTSAPPPGASFVLLPGEGLGFGTLAGDVDQVWNLSYVWQEGGS